MTPALNGHATRAPSVMLATSFRAEQIQDKFVPSLAAIGVEVARVVPVTFSGKIADVDAVLFMFQFCAHSEYDAFKARAKAAGVKFILLEQQAANWVHVLRKGGLNVSGVPLPVQLPKAPPMRTPPVEFTAEPEPPVIITPEPESLTFGAALRRERESAGLTQYDVAARAHLSQSMVCRWEVDKRPVPADAHAALVKLFPALAKAPMPEIATSRYRAVPDDEPDPRPMFHVGLRHEIEASGNSRRLVAETIGVSSALVDQWAVGHRVAADHYEALLLLFPALKDCAKPDFTTRNRSRGNTPQASPAMPAPVEAPVPAMSPPTECAKPRPAPLAGLLRAARALGMTGKVSLEIDDVETVVVVGAERWQGATPDDAVEVARQSLDGRLGDLLRRVEEARAMLGGAK